MRVVYIPANPPSPVPEEAEEGSSPRASVVENGHQNGSLFDAVRGSVFTYLKCILVFFFLSIMFENISKSFYGNTHSKLLLIWYFALNIVNLGIKIITGA